MTTLEILKAHLQSIGADGLCNLQIHNEECGCGIDDLAPCRNWIGDCTPARKVVLSDYDEDEYPDGVVYMPFEEQK